MLRFPLVLCTSSYFTHFLLHVPSHSYSHCRLFLLTLVMDFTVPTISCGLIFELGGLFSGIHYYHPSNLLHLPCILHGTVPWCETNGIVHIISFMRMLHKIIQVFLPSSKESKLCHSPPLNLSMASYSGPLLLVRNFKLRHGNEGHGCGI